MSWKEKLGEWMRFSCIHLVYVKAGTKMYRVRVNQAFLMEKNLGWNVLSGVVRLYIALHCESCVIHCKKSPAVETHLFLLLFSVPECLTSTHMLFHTTWLYQTYPQPLCAGLAVTTISLGIPKNAFKSSLLYYGSHPPQLLFQLCSGMLLTVIAKYFSVSPRCMWVVINKCKF